MVKSSQTDLQTISWQIWGAVLKHQSLAMGLSLTGFQGAGQLEVKGISGAVSKDKHQCEK